MTPFADELRRLIASGKPATVAMKEVWKGVKAGRVAPPKRRASKRAKKAARVIRQLVEKKMRAPSRRSRGRRSIARTNPADSVKAEIRRAVEKFSGFKGEQPKRLDKVQLPDPPRVLLTMGECIGIMYRTRRDGRTDSYRHLFRKGSRPTLAVSSDGKNLYLLGGAYRVTDRGIEDA